MITFNGSGPQGPAGPEGPRGTSAFDPLPSGNSIRGTLAGGIQVTSSGTVYTVINTPLPPSLEGAPSFAVRMAKTPALFQDTDCGPVPGSASCVDFGFLDSNNFCTGTVAVPTAPANTLCIYPSKVFAEFIEFIPQGTTGFALKVGFFDDERVSLKAPFFAGTWAYTAP